MASKAIDRLLTFLRRASRDDEGQGLVFGSCGNELVDDTPAYREAEATAKSLAGKWLYFAKRSPIGSRDQHICSLIIIKGM